MDSRSDEIARHGMRRPDDWAFELAAYLLPIPWCLLSRLYAWCTVFVFVWFAGYALSIVTLGAPSVFRWTVFYLAFVLEQVFRLWFGAVALKTAETRWLQHGTGSFVSHSWWSVPLLWFGVAWWLAVTGASAYVASRSEQAMGALITVAVSVAFFMVAIARWRSSRQMSA